MIAIAIEGLVLGACISSPWIIVVPVSTALVFVPQLVVVAICAYLATREWCARRVDRGGRHSSQNESPVQSASREIWFIETGTERVDSTGIVFESNRNTSA